MSDDKKRTQQMDPRCPRKLKNHPKRWCPLAVMRLKALRNSDKELTEEEENNLPGCPWAVNHQLANYCFFKYAAEYLNSESPPSDSEIAHFNNISQETVKKTVKQAIKKGQNLNSIKELMDSSNGDNILSDDDPESSYSVIK